MKLNIKEIKRKLFHALFGIIVAILIFTTPPIFFQTITICTLILLYYVRVLVIRKYQIPIVKDYLDNIGRMKEVGDGSFYYMFGALIASLFFTPEIAGVSVLVLGISDSVATIFGVHGKYKIFRKKTFEGSAAFFLSCYAIIWYFYNPLTALIVSLVVTPVELLGGFDDNIVIPPICSVAIVLTQGLLF